MPSPKIVIAGASGRMGRALIEAVLSSDDLKLHAALDQPDSPALGSDAGAPLGRATGVAIGADIGAALAGADVLIDFTRPEGTLAHLLACRHHGVAAVVGTTGFTPAQKAELATVAQHVAVVLAPNMSVGVNVLIGLVEQASRALGDGWDAEVFEIHHRHKVDAPSGTALALCEAVARARGSDLAAHAVLARQGQTGERQPAEIGFAALRGGDGVGDHTVFFAGAGERIEITHRSTSRANYAAGSLRAARFVAGRAPGLYGMADVLGLSG
jgi:4-hydroxy-tetrahydrodipicolinate reductase